MVHLKRTSLVYRFTQLLRPSARLGGKLHSLHQQQSTVQEFPQSLPEPITNKHRWGFYSSTCSGNLHKNPSFPADGLTVSFKRHWYTPLVAVFSRSRVIKRFVRHFLKHGPFRVLFSAALFSRGHRIEGHLLYLEERTTCSFEGLR